LKGKRGSGSGVRLLGIILLIVLVLNLSPLLVMVSISLKGEGSVLRSLCDLIPERITLRHYWELLTSGRFARYFLNSAIVALLVVGGNLVLAPMAAYALLRSGLRFTRLLLLLVIATMMIPKHIMMIPLFTMLYRMELIDTYFALVLPFLVDAFNVFFVYQYLKALPREIEEAAFMDGAGLGGTFFRVVFPMLKPALAVVATNTFLINWNSFLLPFILTSSDRVRTLPVGLAIFAQGEHSTDWSLLMAGSVLAAVPTILLWIRSQRIAQSILASR